VEVVRIVALSLVERYSVDDGVDFGVKLTNFVMVSLPSETVRVCVLVSDTVADGDSAHDPDEDSSLVELDEQDEDALPVVDWV
jgi:hypothetical protein